MDRDELRDIVQELADAMHAQARALDKLVDAIDRELYDESEDGGEGA